MDINWLKVEAYDTAVTIEKLQIRLRNLSQQIANAERVNKTSDKPDPKQEG
jgi:hypothetical protein